MNQPDKPAVCLKLLVLKTSQMEKVRTFYEALGLVFDQEQHGQGPIHYAASVGEFVLEIYPLPEGAPVSDVAVRLGFAVNKLTQVVEKMQSLGARIVRSAAQSAWGLRAVVEDPDGRAIELYQA